MFSDRVVMAVSGGARDRKDPIDATGIELLLTELCETKARREHHEITAGGHRRPAIALRRVLRSPGRRICTMASRELYGQRRTLDLLWSRHCGRGNCFHRGLTALIVANLARHQRRPIKFIKPVADG